MNQQHKKSGFALSKFIVIGLLLGFVQAASSAILRLETVSLPLYLHGSETDPEITIQPVPFVAFGADPEWRFPAISTPFLPPGDRAGSAKDINLTTLYGLKVSGTYKENGKDMVVTIDATKAAQPEGYPFTVEQVIDAVRTCVKLMYPPRPADDGAFEIVVTLPKKKSPPPK